MSSARTFFMSPTVAHAALVDMEFKRLVVFYAKFAGILQQPTKELGEFLDCRAHVYFRVRDFVSSISVQYVLGVISGIYVPLPQGRKKR